MIGREGNSRNSVHRKRHSFFEHHHVGRTGPNRRVKYFATQGVPELNANLGSVQIAQLGGSMQIGLSGRFLLHRSEHVGLRKRQFREDKTLNQGTIYGFHIPNIMIFRKISQ